MRLRLVLGALALAGCTAQAEPSTAPATGLSDARCPALSVVGETFTREAFLQGSGGPDGCARWDKTACADGRDLAHVDYFGGRHYWSRIGEPWRESVSSAGDNPLYQAALKDCLQ